MAFIFPYPEGSDTPPVLVPYVASFKYDLDVPDAFERFAKQQGFTSSAHPELDITRDPLELCSLMQSWLYFGLIAEVTDQPIDHTMFLLHGDSGHEDPCIDIRINMALDALVKNRRTVDEGLEWTLLKRRKYHLRECLLFAQQMCNSFEKVSASHDSTFAAVCLSVRLLLVHLKRVVEFEEPEWDGQSYTFKEPEADRDGWETPLLIPSNLTSSTPPIALLLSRLQHTGTCLRTLFSNGASFGYAELYYLSSLRRSPQAELHGLCHFEPLSN